MTSSYIEQPKRIRDLNNLGPASEKVLADIGTLTIDEFMSTDPFELYARVKPIKNMGLNFLYAIIGAQENISWIEVKNTRKVDILMRLDDMGLAPK